MKRREFLRAASILAGAAGVPGFWRRAGMAAEPGPDAPTLVVVELTGGNDGLNMVIPYQDDLYHKARPSLRIAADKVLKLDDHLGLHPAMKGLHTLWEGGKLKVATNVGYPSPSRSHFRSMEIWQSGGIEATPTTGWIGRAADAATAHAPACFVGQIETPLAVRGRDRAPFAVSDLQGMSLRPGASFAPLLPEGETSASLAADRVSQAMDAARRISERVTAIPADPSDGSREGLDARLGTIAGLIAAGAGSRIYYTSLDGFDTHASQQYAHQDLLRRLSEAVSRFHGDLEAKKLSDRVVVLVFSEFGRRVEENGSKGTDHGAAAPVLLIGSPLAGGLIGGPPDLAHLDEGDIAFTTDFRDLYAAVLADWLRIDPRPVVGRDKREGMTLVRV